MPSTIRGGVREILYTIIQKFKEKQEERKALLMQKINCLVTVTKFIENLDVHVDKSVLENVKQLKEVEETELACQTQTKYLEEVSSMTDISVSSLKRISNEGKLNNSVFVEEAMAEISVILVNGCCQWGPVCSRLQEPVFQFFAVLYPLRLPAAKKRSKQMLYFAWTMALACSLPQSLVFSVKQHPVIPGFSQCVSFDAFSSVRHEVIYNVFCLSAMYFFPLAIITACYLCIFCEIHKTSREIDGQSDCTEGQSVRLRRSDRRVLERARRRTLRMTIAIVSVFALCWLPYAVMAMWYMVDRESAQRVSNRVQGLLFAMAVSNSCMNPLVYGSYCLDLGGVLRRFWKRMCCAATAASETTGHSGSRSVKNLNVENHLVPKNSGVRPKLGVRFAETTLCVGAAGGVAATLAPARAPA